MTFRVRDGSVATYQPNKWLGRWLRSDRLVTDRSLRSDRPRGLVDRYVVTDSLRIGRYVATDREAWSVAT